MEPIGHGVADPAPTTKTPPAPHLRVVPPAEPPLHDWRRFLRERERRDLTLDQLVVAYLAAYPTLLTRKGLRRRRSLRDVTSALKRHFQREFAGMPARELKADHLTAWLEAQAAVPMPGRARPLAGATILKHLTFVAGLLEWGVEVGALEANVARLVPARAKPSKDPIDPFRPELEVLSLRDATRLAYHPAIPFERRLLWMLALFTGARIGELSGLSWGDLGPGEPLSSLTIRFQWSSKDAEMRETKAFEPRQVPVVPALAERLREARAWLERELGRPARDDLPIAVYVPRYARNLKPRRGWAEVDPLPRWDERRALEWWHRDLAMLGIASPASGHRRLHATRHTFITTLCTKLEAPERAVMDCTHSSAGEAASSAFFRYLHMPWSTKCAALARLWPDQGVRAALAAPPGAQLELLYVDIRTPPPALVRPGERSSLLRTGPAAADGVRALRAPCLDEAARTTRLSASADQGELFPRGAS